LTNCAMNAKSAIVADRQRVDAWWTLASSRASRGKDETPVS
jgi:hypothetical protein